jgi:hypothetical protein
MQEWLETIAKGIPLVDKDGNQVYDKSGFPQYLVPPNPNQAFNCFMQVSEFHVPKLARTELVGDKENPLTVQLVQF